MCVLESVSEWRFKLVCSGPVGHWLTDSILHECYCSLEVSVSAKKYFE